MKQAICVLFVGLGLAGNLRAQIVAGDVAIVYADLAGDKFSFVALRDIGASEELFWVSKGWLAGNAFRQGESTGSGDVTGAAAIAAGTVMDVVPNGNAFSAGGDQVFLFTGTVAAPSLVYGIDWGNAMGWDATATDANTSADPAVTSAPGGIGDVHTVSLGANPTYRFTGTTTGTPAELLAAISDPSNWSTTSDSEWRGGNFTVVPEPRHYALLTGGGLLGFALVLRGRRHSTSSLV